MFDLKIKKNIVKNIIKIINGKFVNFILLYKIIIFYIKN